MPATATAPARIKPMTKHDVIEYLGKSKRTVEKYIAEGRLPVTYFNGPNGKTAAFERAAVERFKLEMDTPMVRATAAGNGDVKMSTTALHSVPVRSEPALMPDVRAFAALLGDVLRSREGQLMLPAAAPAPSEKRWAPWLTLAEAAEYSGLPTGYLLAQARSGAIRAINVGTGTKVFWRFSRRALAQ